MEYIFDTNAYRTLAYGLTLDEAIALAKKLNQHETVLGHTSIVSTVVLMELMQHLINGDPGMHECYKALCMAFHHTSQIDYQKMVQTGNYIPPMNIILAQDFFDSNPKDLILYRRVMGLFAELAKDADIKKCDQFENDLKAIKSQILYEKQGFRDNLAEFLAYLNNGALDWKYINQNDAERKRFFEKIRNGEIKVLLANSLLLRAHHIMDATDLIADAEERLNVFLHKYDAALNMNLTIMESVGQGVEKLNDPTDVRWNTLNDIQIMFALLFTKDTQSDKILVTQEKKIKQSAAKSGIENKIMTIEQYLQSIKFTH